MKLFVLILLAGTLLSVAHAQVPDSPAGLPANLPTPEQLQASLDTFLNRQLLATLAEFDDAGPRQWMNYVPSVGVGYNLSISLKIGSYPLLVEQVMVPPFLWRCHCQHDAPAVGQVQ